MKRARAWANPQRGVVLIAVMVFLVVIAALAAWQSADEAGGRLQAGAEAERFHANVLAEAGMKHAEWLVKQNACGSAALPATDFGGGTYSATFTPGAGATVTIEATGTLTNGVSGERSGQSDFYGAPVNAELSLGSGLDDTYIRHGAHWEYNYGISPTLDVEPIDRRHTLIRWNMGMLPSGTRIDQALLDLYLESGDAFSNINYTAHRVTRSWQEGVEDEVEIPYGQAGATWEKYAAFSDWSTQGGDYDPEPFAELVIAGPTPGWYTWNVTEQMRRWLDAVQANQGLLLRAGTNDRDIVSFTSSDSPIVSQHPRLTLTIACPCGIVCTVLNGGGRVLLVTDSPTPNTIEASIRDRLRAWGYSVNTINDGAQPSAFNNAFALNDVVYVPDTIGPGTLGDKLLGAPIGVVYEPGELNEVFGIASDSATPFGSSVDITDNAHFITQPFALGPVALFPANYELRTVSGTVAPGAEVLAQIAGAGSLMALDAGQPLDGGGTAAGRRVMLPFGAAATTWPNLNHNGYVIVNRALQWGIGLGAVSDKVLMVVIDPANLTEQEADKRSLIQSWGFIVTLIDVHDDQATIDAAVATNDVVFVTEDITAADLGTKLRNAAIGVVTEEANLSDEFGLSDGVLWGSGEQIEIVNNLHYITEMFALGALTVLNGPQSLARLDGNMAPQLQSLGESAGSSALAAVEAGAAILGGASAAGRRVQLPWGRNDLDINDLTAAGRTIMRRALEWGAAPPEPIGFYLDEFPDFTCEGADEYRGSSGTRDWSTEAWIEIGDDGKACGAALRVMDDPAIADPPGNRLRLQNKERAVRRAVDLSGFTSVFLSFDYRRDDVRDAGAFRISISGDGGSTWDILDGFGAGLDADYLSASYDISAYASADAVIEFWTNESFNNEAYIDNVRIDVTGIGGGAGGNPCLDTFADDFETGDYANSTGTQLWSTDWLEINENDGPGGGDEEIKSFGGSETLKVADNDGGGEGVEREADLSGYVSATLEFDYWRKKFDNIADFVTIDISSNGGALWTELGRFEGPADDDGEPPLKASYDISAHLAANTRIRFLTSPVLEGGDEFYVDELEIRANSCGE